MSAETHLIHNYTSAKLSTDQVELYVTLTGGHLAPVNFSLEGGKVSPYAINPWVDEKIDGDMPNLIKVLRGDFFCLPFGVSDSLPHPHGAIANMDWSLVAVESRKLTLEIELDDIGGRVTKEISLVAGQHAIYQKHTISDIEGSFNYGHHPILGFPEQGGPFAIRTSPIQFGQVYPDRFEDPATGGYSSLKAGATFTSLDQVPLAEGSTTSLLEYPARAGFEDLVLFAAKDENFAWMAVTFDGYAWISLKNPKQFPSTLFWISNGGRHYAPWNGRHRRRLGIEDVCSYFHEGVESSRRNQLPNEIPTVAKFSKATPKVLNHIQMVCPLATNFGVVESVERDDDGNGVWLLNREGKKVFAPVNWKFIGD